MIIIAATTTAITAIIMIITVVIMAVIPSCCNDQLIALNVALTLMSVGHRRATCPQQTPANAGNESISNGMDVGRRRRRRRRRG